MVLVKMVDVVNGTLLLVVLVKAVDVVEVVDVAGVSGGDGVFAQRLNVARQGCRDSELADRLCCSAQERERRRWVRAEETFPRTPVAN